MLPGVPRVIRGKLADTLQPLVAGRLGGPRRVVRSRTLRSTGVAESLVAEKIAAITGGVGDVELAYLPTVEGVDLRETVRNASPEEADSRLAQAAARLHSALGDAIYGEGEADLAAVVLDLCRARNLTIGVAESCTGGMLGERLTAVPGSSDVVRGGVIAYANEVKQTLLGVSEATLAEHGAVSEQVVRTMASSARRLLGVDAALAITGIAGPAGGSAEKPVGTVWIALDLQGAVEAVLLRLWGDRKEIRQRSAQGALNLLRRALTAR
jgi:nicotinamide-nucleotide amidase